jgi:hypothetical protein
MTGTMISVTATGPMGVLSGEMALGPARETTYS